MRKLALMAALVTCANAAQACNVNSWFFKESSYSKTVLQLHLDMSGCAAHQKTDVKLYDGEAFLGAATFYGNKTHVPVDIERPLKKNTVITLSTNVGSP